MFQTKIKDCFWLKPGNLRSVFSLYYVFHQTNYLKMRSWIVFRRWATFASNMLIYHRETWWMDALVGNRKGKEERCRNWATQTPMIESTQTIQSDTDDKNYFDQKSWIPNQQVKAIRILSHVRVTRPNFLIKWLQDKWLTISLTKRGRVDSPPPKTER